jgi:redox-sensitive bicupin YhaK (pirin superfamily)
VSFIASLLTWCASSSLACLQEMNDHEQRCRFLQVWLTPDRKGHRPQYGSISYDKADRHNQLLHVLSGVGPSPAWQKVNSRDCIQLHADANVFVSENDGGVSYDLQLAPGRQAYLVCAEGEHLLTAVLEGSFLQPTNITSHVLARLANCMLMCFCMSGAEKMTKPTVERQAAVAAMAVLSSFLDCG